MWLSGLHNKYSYFIINLSKMKIKFGAIIVAGSGKIGGHVITKNRAGAAMRTKVTPSNPRTTYQSTARANLTSISKSWASLTESQRQQWNSAASSFKKTNIFGDGVTPSGFNLYQKLNNNLLNIGQPMITTPPSPASVVGLTGLSVTAVHAGALTITFTADANAGATEYFEVLATEAINAGKSFVKNKFRKIGSIVSTTVSPYVATALYNAKFGAVGAAGKKVFIEIKGVNGTTGQAGVPYQAVAIIS
jgi:hypothetical protein